MVSQWSRWIYEVRYYNPVTLYLVNNNIVINKIKITLKQKKLNSVAEEMSNVVNSVLNYLITKLH